MREDLPDFVVWRQSAVRFRKAIAGKWLHDVGCAAQRVGRGRIQLDAAPDDRLVLFDEVVVQTGLSLGVMKPSFTFSTSVTSSASSPSSRGSFSRKVVL